MAEKSRGGEEDGRAHGEEGEPATSPGDEEEKQEEQEEDATHHKLPMSHKPGRQDLGINIIEGSFDVKDEEKNGKLTVFLLLFGPLLFFHEVAIIVQTLDPNSTH